MATPDPRREGAGNYPLLQLNLNESRLRNSALSQRDSGKTPDKHGLVRFCRRFAMNTFSKLSAGAAAAAMTLSLAAPAEAQYYDRSYRDYRYDRGISAGDIITGVAVLGGIAAIASALGRDGSGYGSRYRDDYRNAVNSCAYEAERAGRGRVHITDIDRRNNYSYRVRGTIDGGYGYDNRGYDSRYGGRYDNRYYGETRRTGFTCWARGDGRINDFRINDGYRW
jgi:hypothetical protein